MLNEERIAEHVRRAVAAAPVLTDPYEHAIVERVLPDAVYDLLLRAIPPAEFFHDRDPIKQNLSFPMDFGPTLSAVAWEYMDDVIARQVIRPAVLKKFHEPLQRLFASLFGTALVDRANSLPQSVHGGRLMLRRPGYYLGASSRSQAGDADVPALSGTKGRQRGARHADLPRADDGEAATSRPTIRERRGASASSSRSSRSDPIRCS